LRRQRARKYEEEWRGLNASVELLELLNVAAKGEEGKNSGGWCGRREKFVSWSTLSLNTLTVPVDSWGRRTRFLIPPGGRSGVITILGCKINRGE